MTQTRYKARPTTYKGIRMRSRLEATFAGWLDTNKFIWDYEPEAFADGQRQWLPDFVIHNANAKFMIRETLLYVDVKPEVDERLAYKQWFDDWDTCANWSEMAGNQPVMMARRLVLPSFRHQAFPLSRGQNAFSTLTASRCFTCKTASFINYKQKHIGCKSCAEPLFISPWREFVDPFASYLKWSQ